MLYYYYYKAGYVSDALKLYYHTMVGISTLHPALYIVRNVLLRKSCSCMVKKKRHVMFFRWWTDLILKMATPPWTHYSTFHFPHSFISIIRCSWRLQLRLCLCQLQLSLFIRNVQLCSKAASFSFYSQTKPRSKVKAISSQKNCQLIICVLHMNIFLIQPTLTRIAFQAPWKSRLPL
jgi:hypothetical protein